ncbi:LURAP1L [Cervus elaphus hippelaphus]|uniref:LURAP1L n=1 Tax=Cervus elaphus hippelaphus TaxID=46360 RepID=A0A212C4Y0_CEREH|nr:LURAP1L [Cervus elaphus hippelaphus]
MEDGPLPDLRDIELKLGRKVPESLLRSLRGEEPVPPERGRDPGGGRGGGGSCCSFPLSSSSSSSSSPTSGSPQPSHSSSTPERLDTKLHLLRQEMVNLRATDGKLMRQLLLINESIESIKWMIEEKATITSRGSSLSGSLCSLLESQSTSLHGSYNSLHDGSDGLDGISVGSYLDTLADDVPGHQTPSDLDQFNKQVLDTLEPYPSPVSPRSMAMGLLLANARWLPAATKSKRCLTAKVYEKAAFLIFSLIGTTYITCAPPSPYVKDTTSVCETLIQAIKGARKEQQSYRKIQITKSFLSAARISLLLGHQPAWRTERGMMPSAFGAMLRRLRSKISLTRWCRCRTVCMYTNQQRFSKPKYLMFTSIEEPSELSLGKMCRITLFIMWDVREKLKWLNSGSKFRRGPSE